MTDTQSFQAAVIAPVAGTPTAQSQQFAIIAVCGETPRTAGGAIMSQAAIIAVVRDYVLPQVYVPVPLTKHLATYPYWVGQYEDDYT